MRVIGTAGHVDHGKSTLVAALTGIHPDRLKEEQEREMTIDLGFAWMQLANGETVGIVDVPGHRDFIENMLSGVGGIDAALFVIAADEGVMPQTREHLAILDLLQIEGGVVALTKTDLVPDAEWLELVEADVRETLQGTVLENAPLVRVSAKTRAGLPDLMSALETCLGQRPLRPDLGRARLPVDRVFTIPGFGTVVTGTLMDGQFKLGEEVELLPSGLRGRIRGLQAHKKKEQTAVQGSRTAVNISGVDVDQVWRGEILAHPGKYKPSGMLDVHFRLLRDAASALHHNTEVKFFIGSAEVVARVRLLGVEELLPGEEGWLQLELREPVVAVRGDRYILRRPSPSETLGGGAVIDPHPARRHRRSSEEVLRRLEAMQRGTPGEVLGAAFQALGAVPIREAAARSRLSAEQVLAGLRELLDSAQLVLLEAGEPSASGDLLAQLTPAWEALSERAAREVEAYHRANPLRKGMPREELKSRLKLPTRVFNASVRRWAGEARLLESGALVALAGHAIRFSAQQEAALARLRERFAAAPVAGPSVKECQQELGEDGFQAALDLEIFVQVSPEVVFRKQDYDDLVARVRTHFENEPTLTVVQLRDMLNTSRKYILGLLEHLDALGVTQREGDFRRLRR